MPFGALASAPHPAYNATVEPIANPSLTAKTASGCAPRVGWASCSRWLIPALAAVATCLGSAGCARTAPPTPETAFRPADTPPLSDDLALADLATAIDTQRGSLSKKPDKLMRFGSVTVTQQEYAEALGRLAVVLRGSESTGTKISYIQENFSFAEIYGGSDWGEVLLTSYYEPVIEGSLKRSGRFAQPLYAKPADLVTVQLSSFSERFKDESPLKGRLNGASFVPYRSRQEINNGGALRGRGLELCYVDPIDAFFLHIQGSGTITFKSGTSLHLTYADKNGLKYVPIGKFLKEQLAPKPVTMQGIIAALRAMEPAQRDALTNENPSYVFFRRSDQRAVTSMGIPATPGRTIAADPRFMPKGAWAFLSFAKPRLPESITLDAEPIGSEQAGRFVLDQDSGGAITGTGRIDLFWGRGPDAQRYAGVLQDQHARVWYLVPKRP